jgi:CRP-like cAMP-binding protein
MDTKIEVLKQVPLFAGLSPAELQAVAAQVDELDVPAGTTLTVEGERAREFFVLVEGVATVDRQGRTVRTLVSGDVAGEIGLLTRSPRTATVETVVPSRLLVLTDRAFRAVVDTLPSVAARAWATAAQRLH